MAILQALIAWIGRSAGKILNAIFGWAVVALFGRAPPKQQTLLSALVASAAAWPLLLLGVAFPKIAAAVLAFVPLPHSVPSWIVRIVWIVLALAVPLVVGTVIAAKAPPGSPKESAARKLLRGFPITLGIALAFIIMFVTVPVLRLLSIARGRRDEHVPCITEGNEYDDVAADIDRVLVLHRLEATRSKPSWWLSGPAKVLQKLGGKALRGFMPEHLAYWKGEKLEVAFYPSDILIRGEKARAGWAHGLLAEALAHGAGLQTFDAEAQDLERQIRSVWRVYDENPRAHRGSPLLVSRVHDIGRALGTLTVDYDEWQVLYRQTLQLARALEGEPQLLQSLASPTEELMDREKSLTVRTERPLAQAKVGDLVGRVVNLSSELARKEVELAKAELRADVKREIAMAKGVGVAAVCALIGVTLLLVAAVFGLAQVMPGWGAALIVGGVVLAVGAVFFLVGWGKRVTKPLEATQRTLKENYRWAKERLA